MLKGFFVLIVLVSFSFTAQSSESYQYYTGGVFSFEDYDDGSDGRYKSFFAGAYLDPIRLDNDLPIDEAAFWQRTSSIALSYGQYERGDMNEVRGGRIVKKKESSGGSLSLRIAHQSFPLWFAWREYYIRSTELSFLGEGDNNYLKTPDDFDSELTLGVYLGDAVNLDLTYFSDDPLEIYSLNLNVLSKPEHFGYFGFNVGIEKSSDETIDLDVQDGVVRNLDIVNNGWTTFSAQASYYPSKYLSLWLGLSHQDVSKLDLYIRRFGIGGAINFKWGARIALSSARVVQEEYFIWPENDSTHFNFSLAYRF